MAGRIISRCCLIAIVYFEAILDTSSPCFILRRALTLWRGLSVIFRCFIVAALLSWMGKPTCQLRNTVLANYCTIAAAAALSSYRLNQIEMLAVALTPCVGLSFAIRECSRSQFHSFGSTKTARLNGRGKDSTSEDSTASNNDGVQEERGGRSAEKGLLL